MTDTDGTKQWQETRDWREPSLVRRWHRRISRARIEELKLAPGDLRTPEAGFLEEVRSGSMGLAGQTISFGDGSPFRIPAPSLAYARELHGFSWLRHLQANRADEVETLAQQLMSAWVEAGGRSQSIACEPLVTARRVLSWLAHANIALHHAALAQYDAIMDALSEDLSWLDRKTPSLPPGIARLACALASLEAAMCRGYDAKAIRPHEAAFYDDLAAQFACDGVHASRSPAASIELLLDLVPLRQMYAARHVAAPEALTGKIDKMLLALARLRLGDGSIARHNGMGATVLEQVSVLLGGSGSGLGHGSAIMADAGYARLEAGKTIVVADVGAPPVMPFRASAHSGALSFEMTLGRAPLVCNGGIGDAVDAKVARATANASTLMLANADQFGDLAEVVDAGGSFSETDTASVLDAFHGGYRVRFGLVHQRRLSLVRDGRRLDGQDRLAGKPERLAAGLPYAVRFRLHPSVRVDLDAAGDVRLAAANGMRARFKSEQGKVAIEPATFHAAATKPQPCMAIVVHALTDATDTIDWHIAVGV